MKPLRASVCHFDHVPRLAPEPDEIVVVIDALRATTSIACALAYGAREIVPVAHAEAARELAAALSGTLLAGERDNRKIPGFDLGNSPIEYDRRVADKTLVMVTTNGTRVLSALRDAPAVWCAAFANAASVANALAASQAAAVTFVCAGQMGAFSLEDFVCAGVLLDKAGRQRPIRCDDEATAARELYRGQRSALLELLRSGNHAQALIEAGFAPDVDFCAQLDRFEILPAMSEGRIAASRGAGAP